MTSKPTKPPKPPKLPRQAAAGSEESDDDRNERIFQCLPKLGSPEYLQQLNTATAAELPAPVVVRAFRELRSLGGGEDGRLSRAAEATLDRLITTEEKYGYLRPLRAKARQMVSASAWIDANELIHEAKVEIALVLAGARGEKAHENWVSFQLQRLTDAWRRIHGRRGERVEPERVTPSIDADTGEEQDPTDGVAAERVDWHGSVEPDKSEWLEAFVCRTLATIRQTRIREVAQDQFSAMPSKIFSKDPNETTTLCQRYGVDRFTIRRWIEAARAKLRVALENQDEVDLDVSWLKIR